MAERPGGNHEAEERRVAKPLQAGDIYNWAKRSKEEPQDEASIERRRMLRSGILEVLSETTAGRKNIIDTADELAAIIESQERMATIEPLTGLLNRRGFERELKNEVSLHQRLQISGKNLWVVMMDANGLKLINDTKGHKEGDKLIVGIADSLREGSRQIDMLARLGGDEFGVLLPEIDQGSVLIWWDRTNRIFTERSISISAGASVVDLREPSVSVHEADQKSYLAKERYRTDGQNHLIFTAS